MTSDAFYEGLPAFKDFNDFTASRHYTPLPADWLIVITDVQNSTRAIQQGKYKDVNAVGAASIVAVLNAVKPLKIPFIFGGDGATLCIPATVKEKVEAALAGAKNMAETGFGLTLRIGLVPMQALAAKGQPVFVGKFRPFPYYEQAMLKGGGLGLAEKLVKDPDPANPYRVKENSTRPQADFSGFECRWNEVESPNGEVVTLLIKVRDEKRAETDHVYEQILREIMTIYGNEEEHHPLRVNRLSLTLSPQKLSVEFRVKNTISSVGKKALEFFRLVIYVLAGKWMMKNNVKNTAGDWGSYKQALVHNTDYRKFDGALRMVITGSAAQREKLKTALEMRRAAQEIVFGLHADPKTLITCIISNYTDDHVHFLDGSQGGYALAAEEMKKQL